jgi:isoamylase
MPGNNDDWVARAFKPPLRVRPSRVPTKILELRGLACLGQDQRNGIQLIDIWGTGMSSHAIHGPGKSFPLGATLAAGGANFSVFAKHSAGAQLLLFDHVDSAIPSKVIDLDRRLNRTYHYWHAFVPGIAAGQLYGYRVFGPLDPINGLRFDPNKLLLDPYGKCIARPTGRSREATQKPGDNAATALKSVVVDPSAYDWEGDQPLGRPFTETIIYEMHCGGFTRHPSSGVAAAKRGTYAGLIDKIPYLKDLGITAVELLPVFAFDDQDGPTGLGNYWGYQPLSFFAPHDRYSSRSDPLGAVDEFRDMVKALHCAGVEVILDVVYNHTTEGNEHGPTICFRGLSNDTYYILAEDKSRYADYTGCGNTLNANESTVRRLIIDSLRYWVSEMHVDGFRFDLASILSRDESGRPMASPPILWDIESDPILANVKLIAEAWDAAGLYQVGHFVGDSWKEWNGKFRDDVRSFLKGDNGKAHAMAYRLTGSPDVYEHEDRDAEQSINFITCHDGFTLNDLVSFNAKHNEANGEKNRDGSDANLSWNCGVEGPTDDPEIERLRNRQIKNLLTVTMLATGTPMLQMGDEVRRSQGGNNNAYCQDNETTWFDWTLIEKHADIHHFVKSLIALRQNRDLPVERHDMKLGELLRLQQFQWHGVKLNAPDWSDESHTLATTVRLLGYPMLLHLIINAYWEPLEFELPPLTEAQGSWRRCIDTYLNSPDDICSWASAPSLHSPACLVQPRSVVILLARE